MSRPPSTTVRLAVDALVAACVAELQADPSGLEGWLEKAKRLGKQELWPQSEVRRIETAARKAAKGK